MILPLLIVFILGPASAPQARPASAAQPNPKEVTMTSRANGAFDVKVTPMQGNDAEWGGFGRLSIDKQFHGDLEATSKGQMMAWGTGVGSGAYVALEKVTGTLKGRSGSFVLMHQGTMAKGAATMVVTVAPDSGTDALTGLTGTMVIHIAGGKHTFEFDYTLP